MVEARHLAGCPCPREVLGPVCGPLLPSAHLLSVLAQPRQHPSLSLVCNTGVSLCSQRGLPAWRRKVTTQRPPPSV